MMWSVSVKGLVDYAATTLVAIVAVVVLIDYVRKQPPPASPPAGAVVSLEPSQIDIGTSPILGSTTSKVGLVVFSDFECRFCRAFAQSALPALKQQFVDSGKLQVVLSIFRSTPSTPMRDTRAS